MFKENKYTKWYFAIIEKARIEKRDGYVEKHHVIPVCLGGMNARSNLIRLSAREHFLCHLLLVRMSDNIGLKFAVNMMLFSNQFQKRISNSHWYEYSKKLNSAASKLRSAGKGGYHRGKTIYHNEKNGKEKYFEGNPPEGWVKGWSPKRRNTLSQSNKGKIGYICGDKRINLDPGVEPPEGFVKGGHSNPIEFRNIGSKIYFSPLTGEETKSYSQPEGWLAGRSKIWITNGQESRLLNLVTEKTIPEGWRRGKHNNRKPFAIKPVMTPFGIFESPLRFCEKFRLDSGFFRTLDSRPNQSSIRKLGMDPSSNKLTKRELGFYFISSSSSSGGATQSE